ncbi:MAG: sigma 54-interacting transcriptional regulator [Desulfovibrio sp.]|nr:sigma 54-interacting transcriptional regulator [Desulfovibrio sp.]MDY4806865.1 sigma 54-interacting transcriptional regulator [Desulfovibrio sp.]
MGKTIDYRDAAYWKDIVKAKQAFLAGDQAAAEGRVRPLVLDSWKRCLPFLGRKLAKKRTCLEQSALTHVMQQNRELLACAIPVIEYLNTILGSSSTVVLLTSGDGVLLHKHVGTKSRAAAALLSLGMLMGEEYEGTTSTALCLREQSVVELFGAEHLIREEEDLCCISAPIFGGKRRMLGVLTIALPLELYHLHTSGMVLMAAKDISDQHHLHDLLSDQEAILEQVDTGIVVLDKNGGIKAANCTGRSMLHISPPPAPLGNINDVLGSAESLLMMIQSRKNIRDRECFFNLTDGGSLQCMLSAAPIPNDKGMVLFLHEASKAQRLAAHSVGAKAIYTFSSIIGESPSLQKAIELSKVASHSNITTLILGESGTGKELFAHAIHNASARKNAPFVVVNCGALPRDLIQSELFGYDPGAFTGAQKQGKPGKFELAEGGTIFLDEIGDMPLEAQINLLRVIQNKEVSRIGGKFSRPIDVRIIAATNKRLQQSVRDGSFREDLFYRLSVLTIDVPPLRERQQDVMLLAESFLRAGVQAIHKPCRGFSAEVAEIFSRYPWPGNVRELENIVERSLNIARGDTIEREDLPLSLLEREDEDLGGRNRWQAAPAPGNSPAAALPGRDTGRGGTLQSREVEILLDVLKANGGNMRKTAQELGIARSALYAKLHRMGIDIAALRSGR